MDERYELKEVNLLSAISMGEPGKRTFFLIMGDKDEWVRVWLEKEQLEALGMAVDQFLHTISQEYHREPSHSEGPPLSNEIPKVMPTVELGIDQITIGFDEDKATIGILVHPVGPQKVDWTEIYCWASLAQLEKLGEEAKALCEAGRPRCVFCGGPIDPEGHICPKNN